MPPAEELFAQVNALQSTVAELRTEKAQLQMQVAWLRQQLFGGGKSETLDRAQLLLQLEALEKLAAPGTPASRPVAAHERAAPRPPAARTLPAETFAHLPVRETIVIEPPEVQAAPEQYERIGEERTFEVDIDPPKLFKRAIVRPKYRARLEATQPPLLAPAPLRPVPGGYASAGLLAYIALSKYVDHLPLYRLEKMSSRWGARLPRQSMAEWIDQVSQWLAPVVRVMHRELLAGGYVQVDETPVRCHDPDLHRGRTSQGYLWVVSRPGGEVVFQWRASRRHEEVTSLLDGYVGLLQSDGYHAYPSFVRTHAGCTWLGCWAHARRKFFDALKDAPRIVPVVLQLIAQLYRHEHAWDAAQLAPAARAAAREKHFARTLRWLKALTEQQRAAALPGSTLGKACAYLLNHWAPLTAHVQHGETRLDNNLVENAIRPSAIGKKNWLFIGHPDAGDRSANIYSIVVSCQRCGVDALAYLRDVLTRLPAMTNQDDLAALTPARWQPAAPVSA
jgi:transposase